MNPRTGPGPIRNLRTKTRTNWIALNVSNCRHEMIFIHHKRTEPFLPEMATPERITKTPVGHSSQALGNK